MPVVIPDTLPAKRILESENVFLVGKNPSSHQSTRSLKLGILNLMPTKIATETQLLRLLGNSALEVEVSLLHTRSHQSKNTPERHLFAHYRCFDEIQNERFDGLIVTGAPVEHIPFEDVKYWQELQTILDWSENNVRSTFHICWGAQAGLYHHYGIPKYPLPEKIFGVFQHRLLDRSEKLTRGFDDLFYAPHSRHTEIRREDIDKAHNLDILAEADESGVYIIASKDRRKIYVTGHSEYDPLTLRDEYERDFNKGLPITPPKNYFQGDNPNKPPIVKWRGHAHLLFSNWLNYYVYGKNDPAH